LRGGHRIRIQRRKLSHGRRRCRLLLICRNMSSGRTGIITLLGLRHIGNALRYGVIVYSHIEGLGN
jgi:hypothetical protein